MIVRLFYAGFSEEAELAAVTPDMIDYDNKVIELPSGKNIELSDKLVTLMRKIDATSYIEDSNGKTYALTRSGKRWLKYVINPSNLRSLNEKTIQGLSKNIAQIIEIYIRQPLNIKINTRTLYLLGIYDRICEELGSDGAYKMIVGNRTKESTRIIMKVANLSNPSDYNITNLKRDMKLFIDFEKYDPQCRD